MDDPADDVVSVAQRGFDRFTSGDESVLEFVHPECRWEENQLMGFPGLDAVYVGRDGVRKWMRDTHDVWLRLRCIVEAVDPLDDAIVLATRLSAMGDHDAAADMHLHNVLWARDGMTIRRRIYFDREEALAAAGTPEHLLDDAAT